MRNQNAVQKYNDSPKGRGTEIDIGKLWTKIKFIMMLLVLGVFGLILVQTFQSLEPGENLSISLLLSQTMKTINSISKCLPGVKTISEEISDFEHWNFLIFIGSMVLTVITLSQLCK